MHESLSRLSKYRWSLVRLGVSGSHRLHSYADVSRAQKRPRFAAGLDVLQPMRRRVSGEDSAPRSSAQIARGGIRAASSSLAREGGFARLGMVRPSAEDLWLRIENRRALAALVRTPEWDDLALAVRARMDGRARHAGAGRS